jgi:hypothetical protein
VRFRQVLRLPISVLIGLALIASACTDSAPSQESQVEDDQESTADEATEVSDFCAEAAAFINDRSVTDVSNFSAEFFAGVDQRLSGLVDTAPDDVRASLETLRSGFADSDQIFAEFDYDVTDQRLGPALASVDNEAMLTATDEVQLYLSETCELEPVGSLDPQQVSDIMDAFGVDRALAECLNLELGDVANIDPEELTPELMSRQVCGTSLFALLSGGQPTT